jgi:hypothetical protein
MEVPMHAKIHTVPSLLGTFGRLNKFSLPIVHILFIVHWISQTTEPIALQKVQTANVKAKRQSNKITTWDESSVLGALI